VLEILRNTLKQGDNLTFLLLIFAALIALMCMGFMALALRVRRLNRRITALARGMDGQNLEDTLHTYFDKVEQANRRMELLEQAVGVLQAQIPSCLQRTGMVRYDAFESVGGEQSFSVALLDGKGDGVVLSGVHSRNDVRIYAKQIQQGNASHGLSDEEKRALQASYHG
jgi:hypothetical protein